MGAATLHAIRALLDEHGIVYRHLTHKPTRTSEQAARARGESMRIGGKSLLIKAGERFVIVVISAAMRLNSNALRRTLGVDKSRFATAEELHELLDLEPGSEPPFGEPILPLPLYVDQTVLANDRIAFNAGTLTDSIIMSIEAYRRAARIDRIISVARAPG